MRGKGGVAHGANHPYQNHNFVFVLGGAEAKQAGIKLDKRKIVLGETIKNVGTYTATCKLGYEITAPLTVKVVEG